MKLEPVTKYEMTKSSRLIVKAISAPEMMPGMISWMTTLVNACGRAAEVQSGLDEVLVHLLELRHDVQDDVGEVERDVGDEQRPEAEDRVDAEHRARKGKQQRKGDAR